MLFKLLEVDLNISSNFLVYVVLFATTFLSNFTNNQVALSFLISSMTPFYNVST